MPFAANKNFFELFGLSAAFDIDLTDLTQRYRGLARELHPDRYASGSGQERRLALQMTALLNQAHQTLKDPIARAAYLLQLRGVELGNDTDTKMDPEFLADQIELRERLDDARHDSNPRARYEELATIVERRLQETTDKLRTRLAPDAAHAEQARDIVRELQFLDRIRRQIVEMVEELA